MHDIDTSTTLRRILDREEIRDALCRYARGVDRGDWELVRSAYHPDAYDDHVDYKGDIDGLIEWLDDRFAGVDNSMHFLGNCLIEPYGPDSALVETYFVSSRVAPPSGTAAGQLPETDALCRQAWGRYVDRFERRDGNWGIAHRTVVIDSRFTTVAIGGRRDEGASWGTRDQHDLLHTQRDALSIGKVFP